MKTTIFDTLPSTNDYCEKREFGEDTAIIAREQTGGKGTKGRKFFLSPRRGLSLARPLLPLQGGKLIFAYDSLVHGGG